MSELTWTYKSFDDLPVSALYEILKLRSEVFVVEQNCVYLDLDDKDQQSYHFCGWLGDKLVAYVRIIPPAIAFKEASIGRVCTSPSYRKNGTGRILMQKAIDITLEQFENAGIQIGAQLYLDKFYSSLGFHQIGDGYMEDGIPHIHMVFSE